MSELQLTVAVVGAASEVGRDLREALVERSFPVARLLLYDTPEAILEADDDEEASLTALEQADFSECQIVFFCGSAEQTREIAPQVEDCGSVQIDLTQALVRDETATLVVPEVNAGVVEVAIDEGPLATPLPAATALGVVLHPLEEAARLLRVTVTCFEPVSTAPGGVAELARQTQDLLSGRDPEPKLWPARIAFNLIPQVGELSPTGASEGEWQIQAQVRKVLDLPDLPVRAHVVRVPTFYGLGMTVDVETSEPLDGDTARSILRQAPGVQLHEAGAPLDTLAEEDASEDGAGGEVAVPSDYPTLSEAVGSEATHVGRVSEDPTVAAGISFWLTVDGLRKGTTINAVQIAECVLRELRQRV